MAGIWRKVDAGVFTLELPAGWGMEEGEAGRVVVRDGRGEVLLMMMAVSKGARAGGEGWAGKLGLPVRKVTGRDVQRELKRWVETQSQVTVRGGMRLLGHAGHAVATMEGVEKMRAGVVWWRRWLGRTPRRMWRFWAMMNTHLLVLVSSGGRAEILEKYRGVLDRIVASVHLAERELLLGRRFTEVVVSLARSYFPELAVAVIDDGHLRLGSQPVSLVGLHRRYLASPEDLPTHVRSFLAEVEQELPAEGGLGWERMRGRIFPVLLTGAAARAGGEEMVLEEWVNGLSIGYTVEEGGAERAVTWEEAGRWGVDVEGLHSQSLANLVGKSREQTMEMHQGEGYTVLLLTEPDRHNAARILLPEFHRILREHLGGTFYAAIPTREFLLAFATREETVLKRVGQQIAADYSRAKAGLSGKLFVVTADGVAGDPRD